MHISGPSGLEKGRSLAYRLTVRPAGRVFTGRTFEKDIRIWRNHERCEGAVHRGKWQGRGHAGEHGLCGGLRAGRNSRCGRLSGHAQHRSHRQRPVSGSGHDFRGLVRERGRGRGRGLRAHPGRKRLRGDHEGSGPLPGRRRDHQRRLLHQPPGKPRLLHRKRLHAKLHPASGGPPAHAQELLHSRIRAPQSSGAARGGPHRGGSRPGAEHARGHHRQRSALSQRRAGPPAGHVRHGARARSRKHERLHHPARAGQNVPRPGPHHAHARPARKGGAKPPEHLDQGRRQNRRHHPRREHPFRGGSGGGPETRRLVPGLHPSPAPGADPPLSRLRERPGVCHRGRAPVHPGGYSGGGHRGAGQG